MRVGGVRMLPSAAEALELPEVIPCALRPSPYALNPAPCILKA